MIDLNNLSKRGWTDNEINELQKILDSKQQVKSVTYYGYVNKILYWIAILFAISVNVMISILLIPILMISLTGFKAYVLNFFIALMFGLFFDLIINNMRRDNSQNEVIEGLFIPAMAFVNIFFIYQVISMSYFAVTSFYIVIVNLLLYFIAFNVPFMIGLFANKVMEK